MATETTDATRDRNLVQRFDDWLGAETTPKRAVATYASLGVYFSFLLLPIAWLVLSTLVPSDTLYSGQVLPPLNELSLANYVFVLTFGDFQEYFLNSVVVAIGTTALTLVSGTLAGYALSRFEFPGRKPLLLSYLSTQMLPRVLILIPFFLLMFDLQLVDTLPGLVASHTVLALPFTTWLLKGYFDDIPRSLDEAAKMDGCSQLDILVRIIAPLSIPGFAVAGFYAFITSWNDFLMASILSQTAGTRTLPFGLQLFQSANQVNWGLTLTAAVITMIPVIVLFAVVQNWLVEGLASGGMKGA
ncbi:carbohydrate ABC transporter permease [Halogranum rubrum]|uniref:Binding-protein-dependent transport systems inner membrane component n=1 Tax=Halogranum salarium B-1 TaxID=1210908 RepID=J2ZXG4_9EURY|nr:carbohydrate ABC transporter permease [Halogranum salarium]EJN57698.1 binding-protein-dependent transport systems inner membrane component [Halogranum salarium B-1]